MKNKLNIFSNNKSNDFIKKFLSNYELTISRLEDFNYNQQSTKTNIIIINKDKDFDKINFENLNENNLILSNLINKKLNLNNKLQLLKTPVSVNTIKNKIKNFLQNIKIHFHDICIDNEKLINLKNNSFCYLTKVEHEIITCLITEKEISKNFIKENILKIRPSIQTNSLESHLTRIRKKMNEIETIVKIQTRNEKLLITI